MKDAESAKPAAPQEVIPWDEDRVNLYKICKDRGIRVCAYSKAAEVLNLLSIDPKRTPGFACIIDADSPAIFFDDTCQREERRYTVAHELGHLLLGHLTFRETSLSKLPEFKEIEANIFAAVFTANDIFCQYSPVVRAQKEVHNEH